MPQDNLAPKVSWIINTDMTSINDECKDYSNYLNTITEIINGREWKVREGVYSHNVGQVGTYRREYSFVGGGKCALVSTYIRLNSYEDNTSELNVRLDVVQKILEEVAETFAVKEEDKTADWKTFKSNAFNYEIKYPNEFEVKNAIKPINKNQDSARYRSEDYIFSFGIFARNQDFLVEGCLKDLSGNAITKTKEINGNKFYVYKENKIGAGGRMALSEGAILNEYHTIHNNHCYYITYVIVPKNPKTVSLNETQDKLKILNQIFSTFKFTETAQ